jgi:hypothetical protein
VLAPDPGTRVDELTLRRCIHQGKRQYLSRAGVEADVYTAHLFVIEVTQDRSDGAGQHEGSCTFVTTIVRCPAGSEMARL